MYTSHVPSRPDGIAGHPVVGGTQQRSTRERHTSDGAQTHAQRLALGYARRRTYLVGAMLGGSCVTGSGVVWALTALVAGLSPASGALMTAVGVALVALGWLATVGVRFSRRDPKPLDDAAGMEFNTRINVIATWIALGIIWGGCLALVLFAPRGRELDAVVLVPSFMAFPAVLLGGILRVRSIVVRREALFSRWLARRGH